MTDSDGDGLIDAYYVAVSSESLEESTARNFHPPSDSLPSREGGIFSFPSPLIKNYLLSLEGRGLRRGWDYFASTLLPSAHALSVSELPPGDSTGLPATVTNYCTQDNVTLANINTDGSFEAYPTGTNASSYYIYVTDCSTLSRFGQYGGFV